MITYTSKSDFCILTALPNDISIIQFFLNKFVYANQLVCALPKF